MQMSVVLAVCLRRPQVSKGKNVTAILNLNDYLPSPFTFKVGEVVPEISNQFQ